MTPKAFGGIEKYERKKEVAEGRRRLYDELHQL
jgi:hypothetical protein